MSYLVLARKWRPQVFEDVIGQRAITQTLQNAIAQKRVAHAFLFAGARGVGKTSTARILAKALNCEKGPQVNPCNQCASCQEISSGASMDVIEIDGASNRGIDEIRELRENVRYTPAKSRHKIYIIDEVHMLTREAFNALLKTLEEPPPHIIFVFATTEPHKIPATILSRCQRYDFKRIPLREIVGSLKRIVESEGIQISPRGLLSIAQESEGSLRDAQSLLDQVIAYGGREIKDEEISEVLGLIDRKILSDTIDAIADRDAARCVEIVERIYHFGVDLQHYCRELLQSFRNLILMKVSRHPEVLLELPEEELETFKKQAERFQFDHLNHLFNLLLKGEEEVAQSTFPRTMLEMTLIRLATLPPILPIDEMIKRLEVLEGAAPEPAEIPEAERKVVAEVPEEPEKEEWTEEEARDEEIACSGARTEEAGGSEETLEENAQPKIEDRGGSETKDQGVPSDVRGEAWKRLVDFARARNPILGSFLAFGGLVHLDDEKIELGFEKDSFHYERIVEKENRSLLDSICQDFLQRSVKVIVTALEPGAVPKGKEMTQPGSRVKNENVKEAETESAEHPLVLEALRLFNGRIIDR